MQTEQKLHSKKKCPKVETKYRFLLKRNDFVDNAFSGKYISFMEIHKYLHVERPGYQYISAVPSHPLQLA